MMGKEGEAAKGGVNFIFDAVEMTAFPRIGRAHPLSGTTTIGRRSPREPKRRRGQAFGISEANAPGRGIYLTGGCRSVADVHDLRHQVRISDQCLDFYGDGGTMSRQSLYWALVALFGVPAQATNAEAIAQSIPDEARWLKESNLPAKTRFFIRRDGSFDSCSPPDNRREADMPSTEPPPRSRSS